MDTEEEVLNSEHISLLEDRDGIAIQPSYGSNPVLSQFIPLCLYYIIYN